MKTYLALLIILILSEPARANDILVQWGNPGGDTNIVASTIADKIFDSHTTYIAGSILPPTTNYYSDATERSPFFNGAFSQSWIYDLISDASDGDAITFGKNSGMQGMVVWEDFLSAEPIADLTIEIRGNSGAIEKEFCWLIQDATNQWFASAPTAISNTYETYSVPNISEIEWYAFTPFNNGTALIAATATAPNLSRLSAVGYYAELSADTADKFKAIETRFFRAQAEIPAAVSSYDTGYTIAKVRTAQAAANSLIVASSYEGTLLGMDYAGNLLWTNSLSGIMNHDLWCDDITGDGEDEILAANGDGSIYCVNTQGELLWQFKANDVPMISVCAIHNTNGTAYVAAGGNDLNLYYISATGSVLETIPASSYPTVITPSTTWLDGEEVPSNVHTVNHLRPLPQADGSDILLMNGLINNSSQRSALYRFYPMATTPFQTVDLGWGHGPIGDLRVLDPSNTGTNQVMLGKSAHRSDMSMTRFNLATNGLEKCDLSTYGFETGYWVTQVETIPDGDSYLYFVLSGSHVLLIPPELGSVEGDQVLACKYSFNDLWRNPLTDQIILASSQSGGSCIHIIDPTLDSWQTEYENLNPPGKIQSILDNSEALQTNLDTFTRPAWEREPLTTYLMSPPNEPADLIADITENYNSPVFMGYHWSSHAEDWDRSVLGNSEFEEARDNRKTYDLTQQEVTNAMVSAYNDNGLCTWGGHGTDPYYYDPETLRQVIDAGGGKKSIFVWPELMILHKDEFEFAITNLFEPFAEYGQTNNATLFLRTKHALWQSYIYTPMWSRFLTGEFANSTVASLEETQDQTMELSLAGRLGLWSSGVVDNWGTRCARDNPSYMRSRQYSHQNLPNHFLRNAVFHVSYGAAYINNFTIDSAYSEYMSVLWELIAKGALYVPKRSEILSFSPVHLSVNNPDPIYLADGNNNTTITVGYDADFHPTNPFVFGRLGGEWSGSETKPWHFSRYAAGVKDRRLNFLAPYPNGMVLITPPQHGTFADTNAVRGAMTNYLHPMYKNIMQEFHTDGRYYYSSDGTQQLAADAYRATVSNTIAQATTQLPVTVDGDVAWVCAQTDPYHLRLTLIDSGYLNPKARTATVHFNTINPVGITDLLDGTPYSAMDGTASIDVPLGLFRFIDIELSEPFFPDNGWGDFASKHGLTGKAAADLDQDGQVDLVEYAFGGDPTNAASTASNPTLQITSNSVHFVSTESSLEDPGISYTAEWTDDLISGPWNQAWNTVTYTPIDSAEYKTVERQLSGATHSNLFFRLQVTTPKNAGAE